MPIRFVERFVRADLRKNSTAIYVFGDNFARRGMGGQAKECRGEPNAVGIATKRYPGWRDDAFLTDADMDEWVDANTEAVVAIETALAAGATVNFPLSGIGTGLAELSMRAPELYRHIQMWVDRLDRTYGR